MVTELESRTLAELRESDGYLLLTDSQDVQDALEYTVSVFDETPTGAVIRTEKDSHGDTVDIAEVWVTYSSRPWEIFAEYYRVR